MRTPFQLSARPKTAFPERLRGFLLSPTSSGCAAGPAPPARRPIASHSSLPHEPEQPAGYGAGPVASVWFLESQPQIRSATRTEPVLSRQESRVKFSTGGEKTLRHRPRWAPSGARAHSRFRPLHAGNESAADARESSDSAGEDGDRVG